MRVSEILDNAAIRNEKAQEARQTCTAKSGGANVQIDYSFAAISAPWWLSKLLGERFSAFCGQ